MEEEAVSGTVSRGVAGPSYAFIRGEENGGRNRFSPDSLFFTYALCLAILTFPETGA